MYEPGGKCAKWNKSDKDKYFIVSFTLICGTLNKGDRGQTHRNRSEELLPGAIGQRNRQKLVKVYKLSGIKQIRTDSLQYNMMTKGDNIVLYNWNFIREENLSVLTPAPQKDK